MCMYQRLMGCVMLNTVKLLCSALVNAVRFEANLVEAKPYLKESPAAYHHLMEMIRSSNLPPKMKAHMLRRVHTSVMS